MIVKTRLLRKSGVSKCLRGSKVKSVQIKAGSKKVNRKLVKRYKKIFTKKITGAKMTLNVK